MDVDKLLKTVEERRTKIKKVRDGHSKVKQEEALLEEELKVTPPIKTKAPDTKPLPVKEAPRMNDISITVSIREKRVDDKGLVVAGILQEDTLSENNRFYPAAVVREAIASLPGKKSLVGHHTSSPADIVAVIESSHMDAVTGTGFGTFRFGSDAHAAGIHQKVKEGLITDVSIRASGKTKRGKINGQFVDVVEKLDIASVDFVVEGGVAAAKVVKVFENKPSLTYEQEDNDMEVKELEKKLEEQAKASEKLQADLDARDKELQESKDKQVKAEIDAYRSTKLATVKDEETREMVKGQLVGNTKEDIDKQFSKAVSFAEKVLERAKIEDDVIINPKGSEKPKKFRNINDLLESDVLDDQEKAKVLAEAMG